MKNERPHIIVLPRGKSIEFAVKATGGDKTRPREVSDRGRNRDRILNEFDEILSTAMSVDSIDPARIPVSVRAGTEWGVAPSFPGRRNEVLSSIGFRENARLNVAFSSETLNSIEEAAKKYVNHVEGKRRPQNFDFFEAKPNLALTELEDLWASDYAIPELGRELLWEVWMPRASELRFREALEEQGLTARRALQFDQLRVVAVEAAREDFEELVLSGAISQLRPASILTSEIMGLSTGVQQATVLAAERRVAPAHESAPAVCLLDTGIYRDHPLLRGSIDLAAAMSGVNPADWHGHGTQMAGVALFDDLPGLLDIGGTAEPAIRLESVVVQPAQGASDELLPAERLTSAVHLVEDWARRPRTFCFAMSALYEGDDGGVSSLSSEVDRLASEVGAERLICVPAGNLEEHIVFTDYQTLNETMGLATPAQAWNALTVAACTDLDRVPSTHATLAPAGDLSPYSRTSCAWERSYKLPMKPDVVFEGGNQMFDNVNQDLSHHADLCLLTTNHGENDLLGLTVTCPPLVPRS